MTTSMDLDLDLDLDHYSLDDTLALFHLSYDFNEKDLKTAKRAVLKMHPDKSGLDKAYFLFFSAAYKTLFSVYNFRQHSATGAPTEYAAVRATEKADEDAGKARLLAQLAKQKDFNAVFNQLFEQNRLADPDQQSGYGDWLTSNADMDDRQTTQQGLHQAFEIKKKEQYEQRAGQELVLVRELGDHGGGFDLTRDKPEYYSSGVFSNQLPYEDLRKAHVESVIPVALDDYLKRPQYKHADELLQDPQYANVLPPSLEQAHGYLREKEALQTRTDVTRAYALARQDEMAQRANQNFLTSFRRLTV